MAPLPLRARAQAPPAACAWLAAPGCGPASLLGLYLQVDRLGSAVELVAGQV